MDTPKKDMKKMGHHKSLNAAVYSLVALALALTGVAAWQRYSQRKGSEAKDALEQQISALTPGLAVFDGWTPTAGPFRNAPSAPTRCFVCRQCQTSCWTHAQARCPVCPFCGLAMAPQGNDGQGSRIALMGGPSAGALTSPIAIPPGAVRPHAERGPCTNCHTVGNQGPVTIARAASQAPLPKALWRGVAAPPIPADAVKPVLIKPLGMEVCPASGAGAQVAGVMGNSYAEKAGLRAGDVIIGCNGSRVQDVQQFEQLIAKAPPEADAQIKILRNGRTRNVSVMVGEGEMEGFTPIRRP